MADILIDRPELRVTHMIPDAQLLLHCAPESAPALASQMGLSLGNAMLRSSAWDVWHALHLSPDEWLLIGPREKSADMESRFKSDIPLSLVDIGDRSLGLEISGEGARSLLSSGCAMDLDPDRFPPGACTRTLFGKAPVMLWHQSSSQRYRLQYGRSFDAYVTMFIATAAQDLPAVQNGH